MRRLFKPLVIGLVLLCGIAGLAALSLHGKNSTVPSLGTFRVRHGNLAATISATGTLEPVEVVDVGAQVAGRISAFGTDENDRTIDYGSIVEEGGLLAKIDDSVYAADLAVAKAQLEQSHAGELSANAGLEQSKARFVQSEADWNRAGQLSRSKLIPASDFETAQANHEVARANVAVAEAAVAQAKASTVQAQAAVEKAQRNLDFCTIKSPVKGVIIDRRVNIGQTVVASLNAPSLFLIARDLTKMQIWAAVNEADVGKILPDTPVTFTCDSFPNREFAGKVAKVRLNATMNQNVVMYTVEINTDNPNNILLPYLTANIRFILNQQTNVLIVPNAALRWTPSSPAQLAPDIRDQYAAAESSAASGGKRTPGESEHGTLWLKEGEFVRPLTVQLGISDGASTTVTASDLREGVEVVTGERTGKTQAKARNPFLPPVMRR